MPRGTDDITGQILSGHARIRRLLDALDDAARCGDPARARRMLAETWDRAAVLLEMHCEAEEEICYPALYDGHNATLLIRGAIADHDDMRSAVAEARLQEVGSAPWWRAVNAVVAASRLHFAREEQGTLADIWRRMPAERRDALGRQWSAFVTARTLDGGLPRKESLA